MTKPALGQQSSVDSASTGALSLTGPTPPFRTVFTQPGDFCACNAAEAWLYTHGFSVGRMQGPAPRGILRGDHDIQKWRNLSRADIAALHGRMTGDMRNGPVVVEVTK